MNFESVDYKMDRDIKMAKINLAADVLSDTLRGMMQIDDIIRFAHQKFRTITHVEKYPPFGRSDIREYYCLTKKQLENLLMRVPNTSMVEIEMSDLGTVKVEVFCTFIGNFGRNSLLELEYEKDIKWLIDYVRPIGVMMKIKFFYYYL